VIQFSTVNKGTKPRPDDRKQKRRNLTLAAITGQVGCFATLIYIVAVLAGLWLDNTFDTRPYITIGLLALSLPITIFLMFKWVRWTTSRMVFAETDSEDSPKEEEEIGTDS